jgi:hypothetical protein
VLISRENLATQLRVSATPSSDTELLGFGVRGAAPDVGESSSIMTRNWS